jgi:hypothetical protein
MPSEGFKIRKIKLYQLDKHINAVWHSPCSFKKRYRKDPMISFSPVKPGSPGIASALMFEVG